MQKIGRTKYERNGIKFINYVLHLAGSQLFVDDTAEITVDSLHDKSKLWVEQKNVKLIIIDYGQLIKEFLPYGDKNRLFERLRDIAMELNVPIVVLFQFTRRTRQVSYESDFVRILGGNVAWEEYADTLVMLYRRKDSHVTDIKIESKSDNVGRN